MFKDLDNHLQALFTALDLPGASVCALGPNGEQFARGFGHRDAAHPCDEDTIYGVASMSKSITALALCLLEREGKLSLDDPVERYLPRFRIPGTPGCMVTLKHLCTHTSGLPPMEPLEWSIAMNSVERDTPAHRALVASAPNAMRTIDEIIDYIAECPYPALGMPGEVMSYSNEGYALLSYAFDAAAGEPLEAFVQRRVFEPLGMTRTVMDDDCATARAMAGGNITSLYERGEDGELICDDDWSVLPPFRGCAMVKSTARDMAAYYRCLANRGICNGRQVIPAEAVERMVGLSFPLTERPFYCLGLNKRSFHGAVICEHSGGLHGVSSYGSLLLDRGWGFAVLSNLGEADPCEMGWAMLNAALGLPLDTGHSWSHPATIPFSDPDALTGTYISHEGEPVRAQVTRAGEGIALHKGDKPLRAVYCGGSLFNCLDEKGALATRAEFLLRGGSAWAVRLGTRVYAREE